MAKLNLNERRSTSNFITLETDVYRAKITKAVIEENQYGEPDDNGKRPDQLVLTWEITEPIGEQDDDVIGQAVWQRMNPYYGPIRDGGSSKFKLFLDSLVDQGLLELNLDDFDTDALVGIEQRISVEKYKKSQGPNAGQLGNKVVGVLPLARKKKIAQAAPAKKNAPIAVAEGDGEDLF